LQHEKLRQFHQKYSRYFPAAFFLAGFLFDIVTLDRIDSPVSILQQAIYLALVGFLIDRKILLDAGLWSPPLRFAKFWEYQNDVLHFLIGSLLSSYTLFYFVSSSISTSLSFMVLIGILLVANETPALQRQSLQIKTAIYYLCMLSFLSYMVPIILRFVGFTTFMLAVALTMLLSWTNRRRLLHKGVGIDSVNRMHIWPAGTVTGVLVILYFFKLVPPLPVSIQYMGVYHKVERQKEDKNVFVLSYERPFWKFWQNGAQTFRAQPGDQVHVFARIFSPASLDDKVVFRWEQLIDDTWQTSDLTKMPIQGGRSDGYRTFTKKENYQPGDWRVRVETQDGREMGRISFSIEQVEPDVREFKVDLE